MITIITNKPTITQNLDGTVNLSFICKKSVIEPINDLKTEIVLEIKEYHQKRTLTQNAYCWKLLNMIAEKLGDTAENIYRQFVKDYGQKDYILIQDEAVETFVKTWGKHGIGWWAEVLRKGKVDNTTTLIVYYGSSSYDSKAMAKLIDPIIEEAEKLGIPTILDYKLLTNEND